MSLLDPQYFNGLSISSLASDQLSINTIESFDYNHTNQDDYNKSHQGIEYISLLR